MRAGCAGRPRLRPALLTSLALHSTEVSISMPASCSTLSSDLVGCWCCDCAACCCVLCCALALHTPARGQQDERRRAVSCRLAGDRERCCSTHDCMLRIVGALQSPVRVVVDHQRALLWTGLLRRVRVWFMGCEVAACNAWACMHSVESLLSSAGTAFMPPARLTGSQHHECAFRAWESTCSVQHLHCNSVE